VEASSFESEYIALRICTEMVEALRYKLRCFGVPVEGPTDLLCDNQSVVTNSSVPTSVLNKRPNAIWYHRVREAQAAGIIRVGWIEGERNVADLFTKTTLSNESKRRFVQFIFNDITTPLPRTYVSHLGYLLAQRQHEPGRWAQACALFTCKLAGTGLVSLW